jgi:hypothetical protein
LAALKSFKSNSAEYEKNFRLRDKNHAHFKLNGQSRTAFGLLKAPELQRLSVTVEELRVGVISVGVMTVEVLSVGVMILSHKTILRDTTLQVTRDCPFNLNGAWFLSRSRKFFSYAALLFLKLFSPAQQNIFYKRKYYFM